MFIDGPIGNAKTDKATKISRVGSKELGFGRKLHIFSLFPVLPNRLPYTQKD